MTIWATLWYAGAVVLTIGYEGQTLEQCNQIGKLIMHDISTAYADPKIKTDLANTIFPTDEFGFTCETEMLPIDQMYMK